MSNRFTGKVALITGAGSGIGRAVAVRLVQEGATVVGADVDEEGLAATAASLDGAPGTFQAFHLDVSSRADCIAAVQACVATHGGLDVLGNIAGIVHSSHFTDVTEDAYRRVMAVNIDGPFFLAQAAMPHLVERAGHLINVSSNSGVHGTPYLSAYSASKHALVGLTRALATEYVKTGVRVNCIAPAGTATNITKNFRMPPDVDLDLAMRMGGFRGQNQPDEVAAVFAFVASDEAPGIHGAVLRVDRGLTVV